MKLSVHAMIYGLHFPVIKTAVQRRIRKLKNREVISAAEGLRKIVEKLRSDKK